MSDYDTFFSPLMLTLNFFSLFENKRKFSKKWLRWFLCGLRLLRLILFLVCVVTFCISTYVLVQKRRNPKQGSFTFLICTGGGQGTISALLLWYWSKKGYIEKFVEIVQLGQEQKPLIGTNNMKALFKIRNVCLLLFYIFLVLGALYNVILYLNDTVMENSVSFMFHEDEKNFSVGIFKFLVWGAYLQNIYFFLCLTIFVTFSFVLRHEFDCVLLMMKNDSISELLYLKLVYNYHLNVCKLLQHFNIIFKRFVFLCYATNIPGLIVILYSAIQNGQQIAQEFKIGLKSSFFLTMALQLTMLSLIPASVCQKAHKPVAELYEAMGKAEDFQTEWYQLAAVFAMKLSTTTIGITVWDLFVITKPIILTTLSLIITYLTLLVDVNEIVNQLEEHATLNYTSLL